MAKNSLLIIIPVYNEEGNIKPLIDNIFKYVKENKSILFVEDNSIDKTRLEIKECQKKYKKIFLKTRRFKLGIGSAHKYALKWAYRKKYKTVITMDADGTHHPKYINQMLKILLEKKFDIISTNRFLKRDSLNDWSLWRKHLTRIRFLIIGKLLKINFDSSGAFRCYNTSNVKLKHLLSAKNNSYSFFWESTFLLNKMKYNIFEIPIKLPARLAGSSKMKFKDILFALLYLILFYFKKN
tara:strand:+ start:129 stop:845 length:717 start_codon:yes stop_codon:yes gene_type:complete